MQFILKIYPIFPHRKEEEVEEDREWEREGKEWLPDPNKFSGEFYQLLELVNPIIHKWFQTIWTTHIFLKDDLNFFPEETIPFSLKFLNFHW